MPFKDKDKNRQYQRERLVSLRLEWIAAHGPCVDCGDWDDLEIDHVDSSLKDPQLKSSTGGGTSKIWTWSKLRREVELAKCVVRCHSCHALKTADSNEHASGFNHGSVSFTQEEILSIRELRKSGLSYRKLGDIFGVSSKAAWRAVNACKYVS